MKTKSWAKHYLLLAVFVASLFVTTVSPFIPVSAKNFSDMTPTEQVKSWLYYNALGACMDVADDSGVNFLADDHNIFDVDSRIKEPNAKAGKWFANPLSGAVNPTIGYFLTGKGLSVGGDRVGCGGDNTDWITDAVSLWGFSSPIDALCSFGFKRDNGSDCRDGSDWFVWGNASLGKYEKAVKDKAYNGSDPSMPEAARYVLARDTFFAGCLGSTSPKAYTGNANDSFTYTVNIVDTSTPNPTVKPTKYYGKKQKSDSIWYSISPNRNNISITCDDLAKQINQYAPAYIQFAKTNPEVAQTDQQQSNTAPASGDDSASTCQVEGIGWIVCPVMNFMAKVVDAAYGFVSSLLVVQPLMTVGATKGVYDAWIVMRNFANIAFVIAFLIIIFSQLTSVGVSNYGIKKMLPRLIVAAILVNISYWICAVAVDLSNIIGASLEGLFQHGLNDQIVLNDLKTSTIDPSGAATGKGWEGITGLILAATATSAIVLYVGLAALLPALIAALLAIVTVFLVLTLRQALIILLVVISPLAFVAYLLPNTESLFNKWRGLLQTLLFMYPIIAFIFGASALASTIVMNSASGTYKIVIQIMGALIAILPLAITPVVMKSAGGLLNKFGGIVNNPNRGPFDRMKKGAEGYRKNRQEYRKNKAMNGGRVLPGKGWSARRSARRDAVLASRQAGLKDATTNYIADKAAENNGDNLFARQMAGGGRFGEVDENRKNAVVASALAQQKKAFAEDVSNMEALIKVRFKDDPQAALEEAIRDGKDVQAVAAQNLLFKSGGSGVSKFRSSVEAGEGSENFSKVADKLRSNITENHGQYAKQKGADIVTWASGNSPTLSAATAGALSDNDLAAQHSGSIEKLVRQNQVSSEQATRMLNDPRVSANLDDKQKAALRGVASQPTPEPAPAPESTPAPAPAPQAPSQQKYTANYSRADLQSMGPQNISMVIDSAGGAANLSDGDIAKIANATRGQAGAETINQQMQDERNRRRGGFDPSAGPQGPLP